MATGAKADGHGDAIGAKYGILYNRCDCIVRTVKNKKYLCKYAMIINWYIMMVP